MTAFHRTPKLQQSEHSSAKLPSSHSCHGTPTEENSDRAPTSPLAPTKVDCQRGQHEPEGEGGTVTLHKHTSFFVRTVSRSGYKRLPLGKAIVGTTLIPKVMPEQQKRIAVSETRHMPKLTLAAPAMAISQSVPAWIEIVIICAVLMGVLVTHGLNMFGYPHYEQDEGTYVSAAWAITHGWLSPYPYGYGHPPLAWVQLAGWLQFSGGFFAFGTAINSARVLMLLMTLASGLLVYALARRLSASHLTAVLALVIFSFSPLSITFQREVLLDNFATFWFLLSLCLLLYRNSRLLWVVMAALCFGMAVLSKEVLLILLPATLYGVWLHTTPFQRSFGLIAFSYTAIALISGFVLLSILKGELLPYEWHLPWDHHAHLSLLNTYIGQVQRGQDQGSIAQAWAAWINGDPLLIMLSIAPLVLNVLIGWWKRIHLLLALLSISFWVLLLRGGVIFPFYILPLIPLTALNAALAFHMLSKWLSVVLRLDLLHVLLGCCVLAALVPYDFQHELAPFNLFTLHPTSVQTQTLIWIRTHVPRTAVVVINPNLYTDLHEQDGEGVGQGALYPYAHVYWNVALDPAVRDTLLRDNWDRIDYVIADGEMLGDINGYKDRMKILEQALQHSILVKEFIGDAYEYIAIYQVKHIYSPPV
ncbi:MAG: phospholipid carrier-dependent glycosyltransferase [Ktedonobacteraceae bacterium]|nr:phospholipid carrier-dependent glycosyltransferase [Ktedonobacteraceae bacterium]